MPAQNELRVLPNSKESEMMILGSIITNENALEICAHILEDDDFYYSEHKTVFKTIQDIFRQNNVVDTHLIFEELKRQKKLNSIGGAEYLTTLAQYAGTSANIEEYVDELKRFSAQRKLIFLAKQIEERSLNQEDPFKITLEAQEALLRFEKEGSGKEKLPIRFLNQFSQNFLLVDPPKKPML